jgi:GNAT superfamily N-acetyltransferase
MGTSAEEQSGKVIREVPYRDIAPLRARAARETVCLAETTNTVWFMAYDDAGTAVACAGVIRLRGGVVRLKGQWTDPSRRGEGFGKALIEHSIRWAIQNHASLVEVFSVRGRTYAAMGFRTYRRLHNGAEVMRKIL